MLGSEDIQVQLFDQKPLLVGPHKQVYFKIINVLHMFTVIL